jgi:hypothetical protein
MKNRHRVSQVVSKLTARRPLRSNGSGHVLRRHEAFIRNDRGAVSDELEKTVAPRPDARPGRGLSYFVPFGG